MHLRRRCLYGNMRLAGENATRTWRNARRRYHRHRRRTAFYLSFEKNPAINVTIREIMQPAIQTNSPEQNARRSTSRPLVPAATEWQSIATILVALLFAIFAGVCSWLVDYRGQVLQLLLACGSLMATLLILERMPTADRTLRIL